MHESAATKKSDATKKFNLFIARFPYGRREDPDVTDWLVSTVLKAKADPRIGDVKQKYFDDTPVTMTRNLAVELARREKSDFLLMLDSDMSFDCELESDSRARPFWDTAFDFAVNHYEKGPCVVGAPYCGPPPHERVYVFRWALRESGIDETLPRLEAFGREEAAQRTGFEEVAALPTGLILYDLRAFDKIETPYFYYSYVDQTESKKMGTEDILNTRNLSLNGVPQYVNWYAWAGHWKMKKVRKPVVIAKEDVADIFKRWDGNAIGAGERTVVVGGKAYGNVASVAWESKADGIPRCIRFRDGTVMNFFASSAGPVSGVDHG